MERLTRSVALVFVVAAVTSSVAADSLDGDGYRFNAGISWLATTGNSESSSLGFSTDYERKEGNWRALLSASALEASKNRETVAEAYSLAARGSRTIRSRLSLTGGAQAEQNRFAGIDFRSTLDLGADWRAIDREGWQLNAVAAGTINREERTDGSTQNNVGALFLARSVLDLSETASTEQSIRFEPNFEESGDYRIDARVSVRADLTSVMALKLAYGLRYDAEPVPGFEKTDTLATASIVFELEQTRGGGD